MSSYNIPDKFYRVAIKAIISNEAGCILLVKERTESWSIPGGGLDYGEETKTALKREIAEELGAEVTSIGDNPKFVFSRKNEGFGVWCFTICYEVMIANAEFKLGDGVTEAQYFSPSEIRTLLLEDADKPLAELI